MYERLICDGCGEAVLEASDLDRAAKDHGWVEDMCPLCHPHSLWNGEHWDSISESPMEVAVQFNAMEAAIQRVRELCDRPSFKARGGALVPVVETRNILRALDGAE